MMPFIKLGQLLIPTYGLSLCLGFLAGCFVVIREFERKGLGQWQAWYSSVLALLAGLAGGRLNYLLDREYFGAVAPVKVLFGGGFAWYGATLAALIVVVGYWLIRKVPVLRALDSAAPALCVAYVLARVGCLLSGDGCYGSPSTLPWAMSFPLGVVPTLQRVHPTPLYEAILCAMLFVVLWALRKRIAVSGYLFSLYLFLAGFERFAVGFTRKAPFVLGSLARVQLVALGSSALGTALFLLIRWRRPHGNGRRPVLTGDAR